MSARLQLVLAGELRGSELAAGTPEELGDLGSCLAKVSGYLVVAKANHFSSLSLSVLICKMGWVVRMVSVFKTCSILCPPI